MKPPRLSRKHAWGYWRVSLDRRTLVSVYPMSGNYQVPLDDLHTVEDSGIRVGEVIARKDSWVDQRVVDDLCRALKELKGRRLRVDAQTGITTFLG